MENTLPANLPRSLALRLTAYDKGPEAERIGLKASIISMTGHRWQAGKAGRRATSSRAEHRGKTKKENIRYAEAVGERSAERPGSSGTDLRILPVLNGDYLLMGCGLAACD